MQNEFFKLAAYNYRQAALHEASGNTIRARLCLQTAEFYADWAEDIMRTKLKLNKANKGSI